MFIHHRYRCTYGLKCRIVRLYTMECIL